MNPNHPPLIALVYAYFIPLAICLAHSWAFQIQKEIDEWKKESTAIGVMGFIPGIGFICAVVCSIKTLCRAITFIITLPTRVKKKLP